MKIAAHIDARGLLCPLPVLRLRKVLAGLAPGAVVEMQATDRMSWVDVPHFCTEAGHRLLNAEEAGGVLTYRVQRGERGAEA